MITQCLNFYNDINVYLCLYAKHLPYFMHIIDYLKSLWTETESGPGEAKCFKGKDTD